MNPHESTKGNLLKAATEVFVEKGFSGARVDEIARRAGANKAMIYYHFRSKKGLYKAVLLQHVGGLQEEIGRVAQAEADPVRRLAAFYGALGRVFRARPALPYMMVREILSGGVHMDVEVARALKGVIAFVRATVEQGVAGGRMRPANPLFVHFTMMAPLMLFGVSRPFRERLMPVAAPEEGPLQPEAFAAHLEDVLVRILTPDTVDRTKQELT